jgi:hypothetical protein
MRVRSRLALSIGTLVAAAGLTAQQQPPTPNPAQSKYPYPVVRDMRGVVPPGPKPLPSPPLGDGPWTFQTTEARIRVSVVTKGFSNPYGLPSFRTGRSSSPNAPGRCAWFVTV